MRTFMRGRDQGFGGEAGPDISLEPYRGAGWPISRRRTKDRATCMNGFWSKAATAHKSMRGEWQVDLAGGMSEEKGEAVSECCVSLLKA
ncbi:hypothetical protein FOPE_03818 [Fonsecaea pedrosoi]|nr:hypothetical protein FOPE_03818 [Fonsecaea pedrosoi]